MEVVRLTGQYAELLGWAMQVTETVRNGTDEATVFAAFTKGGDGAAGGGCFFASLAFCRGVVRWKSKLQTMAAWAKVI